VKECVHFQRSEGEGARRRTEWRRGTRGSKMRKTEEKMGRCDKGKGFSWDENRERIEFRKKGVSV